ncbi:type II toxin-antitoxin system Phd/YefM family antitoxin [Rhodopila sp.]|uniref:type II toxin-antitoxin system Phd/YefM family antitoxin n=1 Tax=Rhodopila sp. TaxID=2480087 RepID=UPI003D0AE8A9
MLTVSAAEFQRNFGRYQDEALKQPLSITRNGRDRLVVLAVEEYQRLKRRDRLVFQSEDLDDTEVKALTEGAMDSRHDHLNAELDE